MRSHGPFGSVLFAALIAWLCTAGPLGAKAAERVALVIGNANYENASRLPNTRNEAEDIAGAMRRLGFDVDLALAFANAASKALRR